MIILNIPYGTQSIPHFFMVLTNAHPSLEKPLELRPVPIQKNRFWMFEGLKNVSPEGLGEKWVMLRLPWEGVSSSIKVKTGPAQGQIGITDIGSWNRVPQSVRLLCTETSTPLRGSQLHNTLTSWKRKRAEERQYFSSIIPCITQFRQLHNC